MAAAGGDCDLRDGAGGGGSGCRGGPMWQLYAVPGCMSDRGAGGAARDGCFAVHRVSHDREEGEHPGGVARRDGAAGVWLRYLPGGLSVEPQGSGGGAGGFADAGGAGKPGAWLVGGTGPGRVQEAVSRLAARADQARVACSGMWRLRWATAASAGSFHGWRSGRPGRIRCWPRARSGRSDSCSRKMLW